MCNNSKIYFIRNGKPMRKGNYFKQYNDSNKLGDVQEINHKNKEYHGLIGDLLICHLW